MKPHLLILVVCLVVFGLVTVSTMALPCDNIDVAVVGSGQRESVSHEVMSVTSGESYVDRQWAIPKIMVPEAWQITSGDASIVIAVLDTGIDREHEDLAGKIIAEVNFTDSPTTNDVYGHGTHVAGIIAAANNSLGVVGLAHNCSLMNVKVADDKGRCDTSVIVKGIRWAVKHDADIINMSLFATKPSLDLEEAVDYAWSQGVVVVGAAGNFMGDKPVYPAYFSNCIGVAATDVNDNVVSWSSRGDWVDVGAPGLAIYSTLPGNVYNYKSGTSMATAHVSGVAGLLLTEVSDYNDDGFVNDEVRMAIESGCDELGIKSIRRGRINAFESVADLLTLK